MFYFRFNTDGFIAPQRIVTVTRYCNGSPISDPYEKVELIPSGEIILVFLRKLSNELSISNIFCHSALYDVIGVPMDSYMIDNESEKSSVELLKYILLKYQNEAIAEFSNKSLNDLGIEIEFCSTIANSTVENKIRTYMEENQLSYLTESVMWKHMSQEEKVDEYA